MNKLQKVGLSALAGSLAMMSASVADVTVGGSGEVTYTSEGGMDESNGNPWGVSQTISFTGWLNCNSATEITSWEVLFAIVFEEILSLLEY